MPVFDFYPGDASGGGLVGFGLDQLAFVVPGKTNEVQGLVVERFSLAGGDRDQCLCAAFVRLESGSIPRHGSPGGGVGGFRRLGSVDFSHGGGHVGILDFLFQSNDGLQSLPVGLGQLAGAVKFRGLGGGLVEFRLAIHDPRVDLGESGEGFRCLLLQRGAGKGFGDDFRGVFGGHLAAKFRAGVGEADQFVRIDPVGGTRHGGSSEIDPATKQESHDSRFNQALPDVLPRLVGRALEDVLRHFVEHFLRDFFQPLHAGGPKYLPEGFGERRADGRKRGTSGTLRELLEHGFHPGRSPEGGRRGGDESGNGGGAACSGPAHSFLPGLDHGSTQRLSAGGGSGGCQCRTGSKPQTSGNQTGPEGRNQAGGTLRHGSKHLPSPTHGAGLPLDLLLAQFLLPRFLCGVGPKEGGNPVSLLLQSVDTRGHAKRNLVPVRGIVRRCEEILKGFDLLFRSP